MNEKNSVVIDCLSATGGGLNRISTSLANELSKVSQVFVEAAPEAGKFPAHVSVKSRQSASRLLSLLMSLSIRWRYQLSPPAVTINVGPSLILTPKCSLKYLLVHDLAFKASTHVNLTSRQKLYRKIVTKQALKRADKIISVSSSTKNELGVHYPRFLAKVQTFPLPIDQIFHDFQWRGGPWSRGEAMCSIFMFGHNTNKGVELVLQALSETEWLRVTIATSKKFWKDSGYSEKIHDLGISARVELLFDASDEQLVDSLVQHDVLAMPSTYEGFGLPVAEALTLGVPTVISNLEVLRETGSNFAVEMRSYTSVEFSQAVSRALQMSSTHWQDAREYFARRTWKWWIEDTGLFQVLEAQVKSIPEEVN